MSRTRQNNRLTSGGYDNDAASLRSTSDLGSDSEDERFIEESRTTLDLHDYDSLVLREEEECENLLIKRGTLDKIKRVLTDSSNNAGLKPSDREARRKWRSKRRGSRRGLKGEGAEEGQLMFEMEEGFKDSSSRSSSSSSLLLDRQKLEKSDNQARLPSRPLRPWLILPTASPIHVVLARICTSDHCGSVYHPCFWCL